MQSGGFRFGANAPVSHGGRLLALGLAGGEAHQAAHLLDKLGDLGVQRLGPRRGSVRAALGRAQGRVRLVEPGRQRVDPRLRAVSASALASAAATLSVADALASSVATADLF